MVQRSSPPPATDAVPPPPSGRRTAIGALAVVVSILVAVPLSVGNPFGDPKDTASPSTRPSSRTSAPTASGSTADGYAAVFGGDATGATDVTSALIAFLESHDGDRVALAPDATYSVTSVAFTASGLTVDFRGARLVGSEPGVSGILRLANANDVVLDDPSIVGTGYQWEATAGDPAENQDALQNEHGIWIDGGSAIAINRPVIRTVRGDGIYIGYQPTKNNPPTEVVINEPDIEQASRNGISPVAGMVTINGGHIDRTGLMGIDFEPNDDGGAASIRGVVSGVDIRHHGDLPAIERTHYAVAAAGYSTATKPSLLIEDMTGDALNMTIRDTTDVRVQDNASDAQVTADFVRCGSVTFEGNVRIGQR